jgi:hypothetical protein
VRAVYPSKSLLQSSVPLIPFECSLFFPQRVFFVYQYLIFPSSVGCLSLEESPSVISTAYSFRVWALCPSKSLLRLSVPYISLSEGVCPSKSLLRLSTPLIPFECGSFVPQRFFFFYKFYSLQVRVVCPSKSLLRLSAPLILLLSAGSVCPSKSLLRSLAPHISFECVLLFPQNVDSVLNTAYCFQVQAACPSKYFSQSIIIYTFRYILTYSSEIPKIW